LGVGPYGRTETEQVLRYRLASHRFGFDPLRRVGRVR